MTDLTFTSLVSKLPANAITASGGDVLISVRAVMGEATVALTDPKIGEFISKFLDAAGAAQNDWNAINNPKYRSYNPPAASTPFRDTTTGLYRATFTYTVSVDIPLNRDQVVAVQASQAGF